MFKRLLAALFALVAATAFAAVDVNKATQAELDSIKGIGPSIATKILDERKKGSFKDWADMVDRVKGVGDGNAAKFSAEGLTVNGQGFKGAAPAAAKADKPAKASAAAAVKADDKAAAAPVAAKAPAAAASSKAEEKAAKKAAAKAAKEEKAAAAKTAKEEKAAAKKAAKADKAVAPAAAASAMPAKK